MDPEGGQDGDKKRKLGDTNIAEDEANSVMDSVDALEVAAEALGVSIPKDLQRTKILKDVETQTESTGPRSKYSDYQVGILSSAYDLCSRPTDKQRRDLGAAINLNVKQIKTWFQNRRQRQRGVYQEAENDHLKRENNNLAEDIHWGRVRSKMFEVENEGLRAELNRKKSKLEDLQRTTASLLQSYRDQYDAEH
eukprot:CAMPEP_0198234014 /NCGR_PEP_ID=MMETSP1446-20131203/98_1 /TAXON_ID=1461542 ORGANISM="Unidentified sp, Strain CCMP2111" /NCGR_SAMPLE_ID=MMETSP1446 /ASSEMBLY_ACC=CAM_ASM_001112 /LENGTH=193 /DNA_ID=CAMNT_0043914735 /DNA_START=296 /DNA_END=877 /DNA_ORIENTATION=-